MNDKLITLPDIVDGEDKSSPLKNCIRNNYRHIKKWAKRVNTNCFRIYDRQIKEYPLAIDYYDGRFCVHYFAGSRENDEPPLELADKAVEAICAIFKASPENIHWRTRIRREKRQQYEKVDQTKDFFTVIEYGVKFKVNLLDYLDTGLFLDHRETRKIVSSESKNKRVLNLFAYTGSFSVHAAMAGSAYTKSVDMSNTYTEWAKDNFKLNHLSLENNEVVRADCLKFLDEEITSGKKYDLIIIDPPTISRSKKMETMFDVQYDYIFLINKSLSLLAQDGAIFFSTNSRKFSFDQDLFGQCQIKELSYKTLPIDFHDPKIHRCWKIKI